MLLFKNSAKFRTDVERTAATTWAAAAAAAVEHKAMEQRALKAQPRLQRGGDLSWVEWSWGHRSRIPFLLLLHPFPVSRYISIPISSIPFPILLAVSFPFP